MNACSLFSRQSPTATPTLNFFLPTRTATPTTDPAQLTLTPSTPTLQVDTPTSTITPSPTRSLTPAPPIVYYTQSGDYLPAVAARFGVSPDEISFTDILDGDGYLQPGLELIIPNLLPDSGPSTLVIPDSEVIYSSSSINFDVIKYVKDAGGYLSTYSEYVLERFLTGGEIIERIAHDYSLNPRLLLALLEYKSGWVFGQPKDDLARKYPMGWFDPASADLNKQLVWVAHQLGAGYYGWRSGSLLMVNFPDGSHLRLNPTLNAGTVALEYYLSRQNQLEDWNELLFSENSIISFYTDLFGDPWLLGQAADPLFPPNLTQPLFELPWRRGRTWGFSGGPHSAWSSDLSLAALDFAPPAEAPGCEVSPDPVTAMSSGLVTSTGPGYVMVDLDNDGYEQTGWVILYMHIATKGKVAKGTWLNTDSIIGYPSCEGGFATGTHVHIARRYNGEWIAADGPLPFIIDGWRAHNGANAYEGTLTKGDQVVISSNIGEHPSLITRPEYPPGP
jgi:LasA protease